jgi:hypothetical protein
MALTNQPYIPLYVRDWLTSSKLKMCSASAHGLMINLMCIMHKEDEYGTLLLGQKFKHSSDICLDFASHFARLLPFDRGEIYTALQELIEESVLYIDENKLICNRMVEDAKLSRTRAKTGATGGKATQKKFKNFARAKHQANTEDENENEYASEIASENILL